MTQPTPYTPTTDFSDEAASNAAGRSTVNATKLDAEFSNINLTLDETLTNLAIIQRDDTKLRDGTVELHTLSAQVRALFAAGGANIRGAWLTATAYAIRDVVTESGATYICATAHTSGTFSTDLAAGRWVLLMFSPSALSAAGVSNTPAGSIAATDVQAAINELDGDVTALAATVAAIDEVPLAGGTMTGLLVLSGDPTDPLGAATKQYVDNVIDGLNAGQCYFEFVSTTQLRLVPRNGNRIFVNGTWLTIPAAGITVSNSGLSANTVYRAYVWSNTGTPTLELATTARATDATFGHEIKSGDATRTLVGMCRTNASTQFYDDASDVGVLSWFNRRRKVCSRRFPSSGSFSTASNSAVATTLATVINALNWGGSAVVATMIGFATPDASDANVTGGIGVDGTALAQSAPASGHAAGVFVPMAARYQSSALSEGNHQYDTRVNATSAVNITVQRSDVNVEVDG